VSFQFAAEGRTGADFAATELAKCYNSAFQLLRKLLW